MKLTRIISAILSAVMLFGTNMSIIYAEYAENLNSVKMREPETRALTVIKTAEGMYLSWRLLLSEDTNFNGSATSNTAFAIYRDGEKIATEEISTNYRDIYGNINSKYSVAPITDGVEGKKCAEKSALESGANYFDIPIEKPENDEEYAVVDMSTADLDGDGEYDLVVCLDKDRRDSAEDGVTGIVYLDAYKSDGTRLWRLNLGKNIRAGAHYTQFLVYDFDGDGKAEMTCKTAPGSIDGLGNYVTSASKIESIKNTDNTVSFVNEKGRINTGDEFFTMFDGETGKALDTIYYPIQRLDLCVWGDDFANRSDRYLAAMAYLDGEKPYAVYQRGYYTGRNYGIYGAGRTGIFAASWNGESLSVDYCFDTYDVNAYENKSNSDSFLPDGTYKGVHGYTSGNEKYIGQGNHNMIAADVDFDGKDEIISGSLCSEVNDENKLVPKWCTFRGHGDDMNLADYDPTHDGYELIVCHEEGGRTVSDISGNEIVLDYGVSVIDPATGEIMHHISASKDTQMVRVGNFGYGGYYQAKGSNGICFTAQGNEVYTTEELDAFFPSTLKSRIFWDGDLYDEMFNYNQVYSWNGTETELIFEPDDYITSFTFSADITGDWREEFVIVPNDSSYLRVYVSDIPTQYKMAGLMYDHNYRNGVVAEQTCYNIPPRIGYYLDDTFFPELTNVDFKSMPTKTEYNVGDELDLAGLDIDVTYSNGITKTATHEYVVTGFDRYKAGKQTITISIDNQAETYDINVDSGMITSGNAVTGYDATSDIAVIPKNAENGDALTSISAGAFINTPVKTLTIFENITEIEKNAIADDIKVLCYKGSMAGFYCEKYGLEYEYIETEDALISELPAIFNETQIQYPSAIRFETDGEIIITDINGTPIEGLSEGIYYDKVNKILSVGKDRNVWFDVTQGDNAYILNLTGEEYERKNVFLYDTLDVPAVSAGKDFIGSAANSNGWILDGDSTNATATVFADWTFDPKKRFVVIENNSNQTAQMYIECDEYITNGKMIAQFEMQLRDGENEVILSSENGKSLSIKQIDDKLYVGSNNDYKLLAENLKTTTKTGAIYKIISIMDFDTKTSDIMLISENNIIAQLDEVAFFDTDENSISKISAVSTAGSSFGIDDFDIQAYSGIYLNIDGAVQSVVAADENLLNECGVMLLAYYNDNDELIDVKISDISGDNNRMPIGNSHADAEYFKVFAWTALDELVPVCKEFMYNK